MNKQRAAFLVRVLAPIALSCCSLALALAESTEPIREAWRRPLGPVQCLAISPDGARVAVVTWASEVLCWEAGRERWRRTLPGAEVVALGAGGRALVYTPLDALRRDLVLIDAKGRPEGRVTAGGPISALSLSPDGQSAAVGTAGGSVELHHLKPRTRPRRLDLPGACQQLSHDSRGNLLVTTAAPAMLLLFSADGRPLWRLPAPPGSEFRIGTPSRTNGEGSMGSITVAAIVAQAAFPRGEMDPGSGRANGSESRAAGTPIDTAGSARERSWPAPKSDQIHIVGIAPSGRLLWRQVLKGRNPSLRVMPSSGDTVIGYERADRRKGTVRYHRVLACFGPEGSPRWEQGGMVYDPLLVSASPAGETVLSLCKGNRFWLLSGGGQELWSYTTPARVRMARASASGSSVAVTTSNGQLLLLTISQGEREARRRESELAQRDSEAER